ncbi:unnamed protein product [Adineta ricciae]|uniref:Uncharacterized protein n=2 Tax=Adineta ricciae TaxID=249248 RepID=A0A813T5C8_ADIRI|nr:unnamed protein product [Adineta ricciae]CAF1107514.1 unnamed protein product [Adineta ricciae]
MFTLRYALNSIRRKIRYVIQSARNHRSLTLFLIVILILVGIFHKEIIYRLYLQTINVKSYRNTITFWSSDYHISPIQDLKTILIPFGVKFFDKSLSYSCSRTGTCYSPLRVLTRKNAQQPSKELAMQFYEFYKDQLEMNLVDAFVCFHPVGMCELYIPFNRTIIIIASTRYELWRFDPSSWTKLNENLKQIAKHPKNIIAANNLYDVEYIRYFTGINATLLPSFCNYTNVNYNPSREEFLIAPIHGKDVEVLFQKLLRISLQSHSIRVVPIRKLYSNYEYSDLAKHPAIIYVPYQVSVMSLFEQYRMNIPLLFPSLDLLTQWHLKYSVVNEKTWDQAWYGTIPNGSRIPGVLSGVPDPNNDRDRTSVRYWLNFSDFYQWPHVTYYDSTDDLVQKLTTTDFPSISKKMKEHNKQVKENLLTKWKEILDNIKRYSPKFY